MMEVRHSSQEYSCRSRCLYIEESYEWGMYDTGGRRSKDEGTDRGWELDPARFSELC